MSGAWRSPTSPGGRAPPTVVCLCRLEQEKSALQKRTRARSVTTDQVVAAQTAEMEKQIEELKKKNCELEAQISTIK